ncbi:acyl-CoA thioesterase [Nocardioides bruguierae]|uniref:Thioesterase family protein n=1 Tax=Nocardioides bruguierae TaxID=2945102 RepID=A0A9X2IFG6_9ACTN|nr:thioesterase family protein [Nocardioides bruguierae]MCM0620409.1 thioesterase family protein [Nocardioides bruguierae]
MRHVYECPLRWADLDLLGHVNNVVYVDYLQEARVDLMRRYGVRPGEAGTAEALVVVRHDLQFLAPLLYRLAPVTIEVWVEEVRAASFTLGYEIFDAHADGTRTVYLRATTVLSPFRFDAERPRRLTAEEKEGLQPYLEPVLGVPGGALERTRWTPTVHLESGRVDLHVRFSDVDVYGHVNNVKYVEYLQEARIAVLAGLWGGDLDRAGETQVVVARLDVDYRVPMVHRDGTYDAWSWISRVGRTSVIVETEFTDGDVVCARARCVLVFFDPATQGSSEPTEAQRAPLVALHEEAVAALGG